MKKPSSLFPVAIILVVLAALILSQLFSLRTPMQQTGEPSGGGYAPADWKIWRDVDYSKATGAYTTYMLQYPRDFNVYEGDLASGGLMNGTRVKIAFPQDSFEIPKSNFGEAYAAISVGKGADALKNCYADPNANNPSRQLIATSTVNGVPFRRGVSTDAGAGQLYTSEVYRTIFNDHCYEIALTVHTGNIQNYDPGTVVEFNKEKAFSLLRQILGTLKFSVSAEPN